MAGFNWKVSSELRKLYNAQRHLEGQIRKALKPLGQKLKKEVKANCPIDSGALKYSIGDKEVIKNGKVTIVVGPRNGYSKMVNVGNETIERIPKLYAKKEEETTHFLSELQPKVEIVRDAVLTAIREIIPLK